MYVLFYLFPQSALGVHCLRHEFQVLWRRYPGIFLNKNFPRTVPGKFLGFLVFFQLKPRKYLQAPMKIQKNLKKSGGFQTQEISWVFSGVSRFFLGFSVSRVPQPTDMELRFFPKKNPKPVKIIPGSAIFGDTMGFTASRTLQPVTALNWQLAKSQLNFEIAFSAKLRPLVSGWPLRTTIHPAGPQLGAGLGFNNHL